MAKKANKGVFKKIPPNFPRQGLRPRQCFDVGEVREACGAIPVGNLVDGVLSSIRFPIRVVHRVDEGVLNVGGA